jgi:translation initiation factor 2 beta subunit (eIF-2beta)/eIF-5
MIDDEKGYKKVMDEKYKIYCKKNSDDLKNASSDNLKHFCQILGGHKRKQQPNIEINTLYEFFKGRKDPMNNSQRHYKMNFQMTLMYIVMGIFLRIIKLVGKMKL